ncbi:MAG: hypothetical protein ABI779_08805 [Acidobacteriota bacterium]
MIYRKRGAVVRWENGTIVRVVESGLAVEEGERFECRPEGAAPGQLDPDSVLSAVEAIRERVRPLLIERLIVTHGRSEHECEDRVWTEETERFHLSIVRGTNRAIVDSTTARMDDLAPIARALAQAGEERDPPRHLRLAPCVTAALLPSLVNAPPADARLVQTAGGLDGYGHPVGESTGAPWPNWYRPSYRSRPVRMPLNLRLESHQTELDPDLPLALALLGPVHGSSARVLIAGAGSVYPATIQVSRVAAVGGLGVWYPYGGGSFGAEMMF